MTVDIATLVHRTGIITGALVLGAGLVLLTDPTAAAAVPFNLGGANAVAVVGFVVALVVGRSRYRTESTWTAVPDVEYRLATPAPGDEIDDLIYRMTEFREGLIEFRDQINDRVREVATAVIMHREQCSRDQAVDRLEDGTWTENKLAAAFFAGAGAAGGSSSLGRRIKRRFLDSETPYERQLRATVETLESVSGLFDDGPGTETGNRDFRAMAGAHVGRESDGEAVAESVRYRAVLETAHWNGIAAVGFVALGVGILAAQPAVLLASVLGFVLAAYARAASPVALSSLEVARNVSDTAPEPGDVVDVTVNVENQHGTFLSDLRLVDSVPESWRVVAGSPRVATALRPGESVTLSYSAVVERGEYRWPLQAVGRDVSGSVEREAYITPDLELACMPSLRTMAEMPVRLQTSTFSGELQTEEGGDGLEFHSVRDYQPGDPKTRIDWNTYASTGEFTTINFRKEHAARVVLLFDCRESAYVSASPGEKHALDASVEAACDTFASLYDQGHLVGTAAFDGISCWLGPSAGRSHVQRTRELFTEHPVFDTLPPTHRAEDDVRYVDPMTQIRRQLPANTQLFLFSPLTDHYTYEVARRLDGTGHLVTVVSPDPTTARTVGQRIARLERVVRIRQLRDRGIRVVNWDTDTALALELTRASQRWTA